MKLLKDQTEKELLENYKKLVKWTVERENGKTNKLQTEYRRGVERIEEYENHMRERGMDTTNMLAEFWLTISEMPLAG